MNIRPLTEADAAVYQPVRLRSLREHPEAFGASYEEECETTPDKVAALLASPDSRFFGAFVDGGLVGIANLWRYPRAKTRHRAMLTAMYVVPEARGQAIGAALVKAVLDYARSVTGLEDVVLAVTVGNESARGLYIRAGFQAYSLDPRYIRVGDDYYDIEWMMLRLNEG
jgi:RimJ/RimL family protein N-acetyltransferase